LPIDIIEDVSAPGAARGGRRNAFENSIRIGRDMATKG
jgi:hypothetical protein